MFRVLVQKNRKKVSKTVFEKKVLFPNGSRFGLFKLIGGVGNPALDDHFDAFGGYIVVVVEPGSEVGAARDTISA